jgi:hypothetical protein
LLQICQISARALLEVCKGRCTGYYSKLIVIYSTIITINVPVVFMARYVMVLGRATSLRGALEGVGPENGDFF